MATTVRVGGPLLGGRSLYSKKVSKRGNTAKTQDDLKSWTTFEPIIHDEFVLLPSEHFVTVLAYKTGRRVASLIPLTEHEEENVVVIESATIATFPASSKDISEALQKLQDDADTSDDDAEEGDCHVLLVGCLDGTIREFDLSVVKSQKRGAPSTSCGPYDIPGPCYRPRRVFALSHDKARPIKHLASASDVSLEGGVLLYALSETKAVDPDGKSKPSLSSANSYLQRIVLPPYDRQDGDKITPLGKDGGPPCVQTLERVKCLVGYDKEGIYHNTTPFRLLVSSKKRERAFSEQSGEDCDVFVIVARSTTLHVFRDKIRSSKFQGETESVAFTTSLNNPLTAVGVAPHGTDIACGYTEGDIRIMSDAIPQVLDYFDRKSKYKENKQGGKPEHPAKTIPTRRVHWHAHPVTCLAYHGVSASVEPMLYSGGYESVLVTWQLSKGTYRPADVLPRLAKGGIVHIRCAQDVPEGASSGILVYCEDNSLQLFESHNKTLLWKVQGLASFTGDSLGDSNARVQSVIRADSQSGANTLMLSGLPGAPGYLHWYDTREQLVTAQLEVTPFNRVSRTEPEDSPLPVPSVTNCASSESGNELLTVDTTPTENSAIGASDLLRDGNSIGVVSTLRFWSRTPQTVNRNPYSLTASMTYPHGEENRVTAVAMSKDGQYACTVSNEENAFRLWHRVLSDDSDEDDQDVDKKSRRTPVWVCRYRVTSPSGYSNFGTSSDAVDFSSDSSILAICYGNTITVWDHKEATLLTALQHLEDDRAPVESLSFVKTDFLHDLILTRSSTGVSLQSPYGNGQDSWSCVLPTNYKDAFVTHAELAPSHDSVVVCMIFPSKGQTHVLLLEAVTGRPRLTHDGKSKPIMWKLPGAICSLGLQGKRTESSTWVDVSSIEESRPEKQSGSLRLYVTMNNGDMLLLQDDAELTPDSGRVVNRALNLSPVAATNAPRLNMLKRGDSLKRRRTDKPVDNEAPPTKRSAMATSFGMSVGDDGDSVPLPSSDLPALGGAFTSAFISRNLARNRQTV